jgi:hypothetical protein
MFFLVNEEETQRLPLRDALKAKGFDRVDDPAP